MVATAMASALTGEQAPSLVVTPAVVAHRGASGHRPEHTLGAYRTALAMGADDLELDLVSTKDHVLVVRHENELSRTTDVAERRELAPLRTTKVVDGQAVSGWFVEDLTVAQLKTLTARERLPHLRPASAAYDGHEGVPTFTEVLAMVQAESVCSGRGIGLAVELKSAAYFDRIGLPLEVPLMADLARHGLDHPRSRVSVMSFEPTVLRRLARDCRLALVQLIEDLDRVPADLAASGDDRTYRDLVSPAGLAWIDGYADGLGVRKELVLPTGSEGRSLPPTRLVRDAHRLWLTVHVWTLRAENHFLPSDFRVGHEPGGLGDLAGYARAFLDAGVDGVITDHPGHLALLAR